MRAERTDVKVECMIFGDIDTTVHPMNQSLAVLREEKAANCVLDRAGSIGSWGSHPVEAPYWFHGVLGWLCRIQPWWILRAGFIPTLRCIKDKAKED